MTLEDLRKQKEKYQNKSDYFFALDFNILANDFKGMVDLISEMEEYIKAEQIIEEEDSDASK